MPSGTVIRFARVTAEQMKRPSLKQKEIKQGATKRLSNETSHSYALFFSSVCAFNAAR